jgi:hypothetical protein
MPTPVPTRSRPHRDVALATVRLTTAFPEWQDGRGPSPGRLDAGGTPAPEENS